MLYFYRYTMKIACLVLAICVAAANAELAPLLRAKERIDGRYIIVIKVRKCIDFLPRGYQVCHL